MSQVPPRHGPTWSKSIGIEYHHHAGAAPARELCDGISDALSFLFGRHLLYVGRTSYDAEGYSIEEHACNPWGRDVIRTCSAPDLPPFRVQHRNTEADFNRIVGSFLKKNQELELHEVVWTLWIAHRMPMGFDLPLYASALERLMQAWFKSTKSKSKGIYMPKKEFDSLLHTDFDSITRNLGERQYADRIVRKIKNSFQMGVNERFEVFFEELGLPYRDNELRAIRARNTSAHGGKNASNDIQEQVKLGRAYQTLLNRVILKILDHTGSYTDYSVDEHPEKPIEEPIGGP
ncbi:hypothetical protein [Sorangium sp. So ce388]|uniref:hypothetical protein n=1 Tax=Sorangium sp. So ce388 TaxID=3133309 RepID=UPI003F5BC33C